MSKKTTLEMELFQWQDLKKELVQELQKERKAMETNQNFIEFFTERLTHNQRLIAAVELQNEEIDKRIDLIQKQITHLVS